MLTNVSRGFECYGGAAAPACVIPTRNRHEAANVYYTRLDGRYVEPWNDHGKVWILIDTTNQREVLTVQQPIFACNTIKNGVLAEAVPQAYALEFY
jgi:hypothetical protein